jgi:hypothetical protein
MRFICLLSSSVSCMTYICINTVKQASFAISSLSHKFRITYQYSNNWLMDYRRNETKKCLIQLIKMLLEYFNQLFKRNVFSYTILHYVHTYMVSACM